MPPSHAVRLIKGLTLASNRLRLVVESRSFMPAYALRRPLLQIPAIFVSGQSSRRVLLKGVRGGFEPLAGTPLGFGGVEKDIFGTQGFALVRLALTLGSNTEARWASGD